MHLASRPVLLATCTSEPNATWVTQQARNLAWGLEDEGVKLSVLIDDRDRKFALQADRVFQSLGARVILTPLMAPRANAHAERWIGSGRRECLDWMLIVNEAPPPGRFRRVLPPLQRRAPASEPQLTTASFPR